MVKMIEKSKLIELYRKIEQVRSLLDDEDDKEIIDILSTVLEDLDGVIDHY